jgi:FAD/FMN-containing dehydrogenase
MLHKDALEKIVGTDNVRDDEVTIEEYSSDMSFIPRVRAACVVKPGSATEVQEIVKWANDTSTPLIPVSSGGPHFRGDTVPSTGGAVVVDLSRMKQILRVDRRNRVCMIEPGVTFDELVPRLGDVGLRLNMPLLPRGSKSVIGSMLEREPVIMPLSQWDAIDPLICTEVVFGTGDLFRTGSAAGPGTLEDQWRAKQAQVTQMGPGQTDFARVVQGAQGTMGIVTWATVRCDVVPRMREAFLVGSDNLDKIADFIYRLLWLKIGDECLVLNNVSAAAMLAQHNEDYSGIVSGLPRWLLLFCLSGIDYFPEERLAYQEKDMMKTAKRFGLEPVKALNGVSAYELSKTLSKPSDEPYWKLRRGGACEDIFFLTTLDRVQRFVTVMHDTAGHSGYSSSDIGIYIQPMVQGTSCHCEFSLFYDPTNAGEIKKVRDLCHRASNELMDAGAFFSRPYGDWAQAVYRRDGDSTAALKKVKGIFDPNSIMNPGKLCF